MATRKYPLFKLPGPAMAAITLSKDDKSIKGKITTSNIKGTGAHIHEGAIGKNGPDIIPLTKTSDDEWAVPSGAKLSDAQYDAFKAGNLYVNIHSDAHKSGEIRGQLKR